MLSGILAALVCILLLLLAWSARRKPEAQLGPSKEETTIQDDAKKAKAETQARAVVELSAIEKMTDEELVDFVNSGD